MIACNKRAENVKAAPSCVARRDIKSAANTFEASCDFRKQLKVLFGIILNLLLGLLLIDMATSRSTRRQ